MEKKSRAPVIMVLLLVAWLYGGGADAAEKKNWKHLCISCHNGTAAPDETWLREKYKTADAFVEGAKKKGERCMNIVKGDEKLIRKIAREIGIKEAVRK